MKSEAEIMPTTDTVSASHNGALATPCCRHTRHSPAHAAGWTVFWLKSPTYPSLYACTSQHLNLPAEVSEGLAQRADLSDSSLRASPAQTHRLDPAKHSTQPLRRPTCPSQLGLGI